MECRRDMVSYKQSWVLASPTSTWPSRIIAESQFMIPSNISPLFAYAAVRRREEKDVSAKATSLLREHLLAARKELDGSGLVIAIVSCSQLTGSAHFVFTRGKKRVGYEYEITMNWELQDAAGVAGAKGTLQLEEVSDSDSDVFSGYKVTLSSAAAEGGYAGKSLAAGDATGLVKRCEDHFRNVIKQWAEAVKSS